MEKEIMSLIKSLRSKQKKLLKKKKETIIKINNLRLEEQKLMKQLKSIKKLDQLIVSIGFDKRWSTYNCIVKFKSFNFSFYLGKEVKIKNQIQQFYSVDISKKRIEFIKNEIKQIVSSVVPNYLNKYNSKESISFKKIIELYVSSGEWGYWKEP